MKQGIQPRWLSIKAASGYCSLSIRRIEQLVADNSLKSHLVGRRRLIDRRSIDAWVEGPTGGDVLTNLPEGATERLAEIIAQKVISLLNERSEPRLEVP